MSGRSSDRKKTTCSKTTTIIGPMLLLLFATSAAFAIKVPRGMDTCPSLKVCLQLLDAVVPATDDGEGSNSEVLARDLSRFGDAAKHELLNRATGNQPGWRNVAGAILSDWPTWDPSDVPALRKALQMNPGGWLARPLGRIATPEAIQVLVEDLPRGEENQTDFALSHLGARAIPYLFPLLKNDLSAASAARVISAMDPVPLSYASGWVTIALDPHKDRDERIAALRGLAALGPNAKPASAELRKLLGAPEASLRRETGIALHAVRDPSVIVELAKECRPKAEAHDSIAIDAVVCLRDVADFGIDGRDAGPYLLQFLGSANGAEQAYGILALGLIGYDEASTKIEGALKSPDWRIVNAAVWSLGWLGDGNATSQLDAIASSYWLPEVGQNAKRSADAIRSPTGHLDIAEWRLRENGVPRDPFWFVSDGIPGKNLECTSNHWRWKDLSFKLSRPNGRASSLRFRKEPMFGELVGTDNGEWGGQLAWLPYKGQSEILLRDNVAGMDYASDGDIGAVVYSGLAHMSFNFGYVLKVSLDSGGTWNQSEIARLPGEPVAWSTITAGLFAVEANNRVVVFSTREGILGLASCAADK